MGGSFSSNVANAVAEVTNEIQTEVSTNIQQGQGCADMVHIGQNCKVGGNFTWTDICRMYATATQVVTQVSNNNLKSSVAQKLLQKATSTVGAAGIGFASANNTTNVFVNSTNSIVNSMTTG